MSRQARKEAAAAARDLLKVDAARLRKGSAATMQKAGAPPVRKGMAAPMRNVTEEHFFTDGSTGNFYAAPDSAPNNGIPTLQILQCAARRKAGINGSGNEKEGGAGDHVDVDELDEQPRPMGQKLAKKLKYAKGKEVDHIDLEELDKFGKIQDEQNANRLKVLEIQQKLSADKME